MAWFDSKTLFVSISLFCLPAIVVCAILSLPLVLFTILTLYAVAWATYLLRAQTDVGFHLPCHPTRVLKINIILVNHLMGWLTDIPLIMSYLYWRYWQVGTEQFRRIVSRDIAYSSQGRLDIYHCEGTCRPAIIFIYGGSWSSGHKRLYTSMANTLRERGYVVVVPDYRKYPAVKVDSMYQDIRQVIQWTFDHANEIGVDADMIYVMGHSAGAHLAAQVVLGDLVNKSKQSDGLPQVEGLLLLAGVYDLEQQYQHETARGVEKISALGRVMGDFHQHSPLYLIETHGDLLAHSNRLLDFAPRILFVHGEKDLMVPKEQSTNMYNMLGQVLPPPKRDHVDVRIRLYKKMNHAHCVTALMPSVFGVNKMQKPLLRDITAFVDAPLLDGCDSP